MIVHVALGGRTESLQVDDLPGTTVLAVLSEYSAIDLPAPCGGRGRCGKCVVTVTPPTPSTEMDRRFLEVIRRDAGERLACTCAAQDGMTVTVAQREERARVKDRIPSFSDEADVWQRAREEGRYAAAVDIGTTTVAVYLVDTESGEVSSVLSAMNRQGMYGADVISRICYSEASPRNLLRLMRVVRGQIHGMISALAAQSAGKDGVTDTGAVVGTVVIAANTTMLHLFAGESPAGIGRAPFVPEFLKLREYPAESRFFAVGRETVGTTILLPSVAAYVGADIVSAAVAADMDRNSNTTLLMDIGTNGELALAHDGAVYTCATAAGPAFEGASIRAGVGGIAGAVNSFERQDSSIVMTTIDNVPPVGLCGAGLLDIVAQLVRDGIVDVTGRLSDGEDVKNLNAPAIRGAWLPRMTESNGEAAVTIAETAAGRLILTQQDIREVQLAKAAIAAGIDVLCHEAGCHAGAIEQVVLTGGFGNHLRVESAIAIGMVPNLPQRHFASLENAAGLGAVRVLRNRTTLERITALASQAVYLELSGHAYFHERYVEHMMFPEEEE